MSTSSSSTMAAATLTDLSDTGSSSGSSPPPATPKTSAKRGRPRLTEDAELAKSKRRAQLRDAQRGLRERKNKHLEELQKRVDELERENRSLKNNVEFLTSFNYPPVEQSSPQPWPMDFALGSLASQDPTFAQISLTYDYDKFVSELLDPLNYPSQLDEQTFVRTLNTLCLTHAMQMLILDTNSAEVQHKFYKPLKISSPAVIASRIAARLVHMVLDGGRIQKDPVPWVDTDLMPWRSSDDLLELSPRDVWGFVKSHPNFNDVDIKAFYKTLVDKSYCSGFGPVLTPTDVESALIKSLRPSLSILV